jgi:hypothetical protein
MYCHLLGNLKPAQHGQAGPGWSSLFDRIGNLHNLGKPGWSSLLERFADRMVEGPKRPILTILLKKRRALKSFRIYGGKKDLASTHRVVKLSSELVRNVPVWLFLLASYQVAAV